MKNFRILLIHEIHSQLKTFSFTVMILTTLVVGLFVTKVQVSSFKDRWTVYKEQQQQSQERLDNVHFFSELEVDVYMPPIVLSVFAKGLDESIGNKISVSAIKLPEPVITSQRGNAFNKIFSNMDISGVVKILSIFIILMAACPIALDREQQIGKLIFSGSVGRLEYYLSKFVALMTVACIVTVVTFLIPVVWMWFDPQVALPLSGTAPILYMLFSTILYFSIFIFIGLAVSAIAAKISTATLSGLMIWIILSYIYPFTVNSMIDRTVKVPSDRDVAEQINRIDNDIFLENERFRRENRFTGTAASCSMSSSNNIIIKNTVASRSFFEYTKKLNDFALPKWFNRINTVTEIKENQKKHLLRKKTLYDRFALFLPDRIYQNLCEEAAGTDYHFREKQFVEAAKDYRSILMNYIQSKNGFGYAFFTQMPESEMLENYSDYTQDTKDRWCKEENLETIASDVPQFNTSRRSKSFMAWAGLLLLNIFAGGISPWIYNKYLSFK